MTVLIIVMVVVSRADNARIDPSCSWAASMNLSGETSTPKSTTSNPPPSSIEATRFLPMSCKSPWTVPITTRPARLTPDSTRWGVIISKEVFIARAAISSSGTKYSLHSKRRPTSSIAGIICF